ncbi:MAG: hypothetical protein HKN80_05950 [Acidimicrobiia bacterium]|nr:hypothetical protein [Acidimicrobiia bacterium]
MCLSLANLLPVSAPEAEDNLKAAQDRGPASWKPPNLIGRLPNIRAPGGVSAIPAFDCGGDLLFEEFFLDVNQPQVYTAAGWAFILP